MAVVGLLTLIEALRGIPRGMTRFLWPALTVAAAVLLPAFVIVPSGRPILDIAPTMWRDPQQRQHLFMAATLLAAGIVELWRRSRRTSRWSGVWPLALFVLGVLLITHTEYGTVNAVSWAKRQHLYQGVTVALAAACFGMARLHNRLGRTSAIVAPVLLLLAAVLLLIYREPPGAYERRESVAVAGSGTIETFTSSLMAAELRLEWTRGILPSVFRVIVRKR